MRKDKTGWIKKSDTNKQTGRKVDRVKHIQGATKIINKGEYRVKQKKQGEKGRKTDRKQENK